MRHRETMAKSKDQFASLDINRKALWVCVAGGVLGAVTTWVLFRQLPKDGNIDLPWTVWLLTPLVVGYYLVCAWQSEANAWGQWMISHLVVVSIAFLVYVLYGGRNADLFARLARLIAWLPGLNCVGAALFIAGPRAVTWLQRLGFPLASYAAAPVAMSWAIALCTVPAQAPAMPQLSDNLGLARVLFSMSAGLLVSLAGWVAFNV